MKKVKKAIIIGAGPAGLTAAYELLTRTDIIPIVIEKSEYLGGISRTVQYKGNRIDIGGHRFFTKSDRVREWWLNILPLQSQKNSQKADQVMLIKQRKSRIYFSKKFFDYPLQFNKKTLTQLGFWQSIQIGLSYLKSALLPIHPEKNLEHFFINRFGKKLYQTFFKTYTEKLWGVPCQTINAEWGVQRIKGLSIAKTLKHALKKFLKKESDIQQKDAETSLIEQFLYPKFGPGQMWEEVAKKITRLGGKIITNQKVTTVYAEGKKIIALETTETKTGQKKEITGDFFFSTMPIQELIKVITSKPPKEIQEISNGLVYRDFITVGLLLNKLKIHDPNNPKQLIKDNWIYIQEPDVLVGRIQIFNNWSPYLVADPSKVWLGLEYFCSCQDEIWNKSDKEIIQLATGELEQMNFIAREDILEATVIRMEKTYPAYFGSYNRFPVLRQYLDQFTNLFLIGRNGMHRYNNQDHSMLAAMVAIDNILDKRTDKSNIWAINIEDEYHESK